MEVDKMKRRKLLTSVLAGSILLGGLAGCAQNSPSKNNRSDVKYEPEVNYAAVKEGTYQSFDEKKAVEAYNGYAMNLFSKVASGGGKSNIMVSPASVMFALDLADAGACKNTLAEINKAIGGDLTPEQQHAFASAWMKSINASKDVEFSAANGIWSNNKIIGTDMNKEYIDYVEKYFDAKVKPMDFGASAVKDINGWVNDKTKGMIDEIVDQLDSNTAAVLVNAIAFEAAWQEQYELIKDGTFKGANGDSEAKFLSETSGSYYESDKAIGFSKMYKGGQYMFVAVLPKDEGIDANKFMSGFTADDYSKFMASVSYAYDVDSKLPKFCYDYENTDLIAVLNALGIKEAFDQEKADFSGIADIGENLYLAKAIHKTHIELDENGTKAAAATALAIDAEGAFFNERETREVICDRPFAYMIVDTNNNMPVFVGTVNDV